MFRIVTVFVLFVFATGCASTTVLHSYPPGATVKSMSGMSLGVTPYEYSDSNTVNHIERFIIEKDGYEPEYVTIKKDQWNTVKTSASVVGGLVLFVPWVGLLWSADYRPDYAVKLKELPVQQAIDEVEVDEDEEEAPRARPAKHQRPSKKSVRGSNVSLRTH